MIRGLQRFSEHIWRQCKGVNFQATSSRSLHYARPSPHQAGDVPPQPTPFAELRLCLQQSHPTSARLSTLGLLISSWRADATARSFSLHHADQQQVHRECKELSSSLAEVALHRLRSITNTQEMLEFISAYAKLALPPPVHMQAALALHLQHFLEQGPPQQQTQQQSSSRPVQRQQMQQQQAGQDQSSPGTGTTSSASHKQHAEPFPYMGSDPHPHTSGPGIEMPNAGPLLSAQAAQLNNPQQHPIWPAIPPVTSQPVSAELLHRLAVSVVLLQLHGHGLWQVIGDQLLPHVASSNPDQLCITLHAMSICRYHHVALFEAAAPILITSCAELAAVSLGRALHAYSTVHHHDSAMCLALSAEVHDRVVGLTHRSLFSLLSRVGLGPGTTVTSKVATQSPTSGSRLQTPGTSGGLIGVGGGTGTGSLKVRDTASSGGLDLAGGLASREFLLLDLCRIIWALVKIGSKDDLLLDALSRDVSAQMLQALSIPSHPQPTNYLLNKSHSLAASTSQPPASSTQSAATSSSREQHNAQEHSPVNSVLVPVNPLSPGQLDGTALSDMVWALCTTGRAQPLLRDTVLAVLPRLTSALQPVGLLQILSALKTASLDNAEVYNNLAVTAQPWLDGLSLSQLGEVAKCFASSPTPQPALMSALCKLAVAAASTASTTHPACQPSHAATAKMHSTHSTHTQAPLSQAGFSHTAHNFDGHAATSATQLVIVPSSAASLISVLDACAQQRVYDEGLISLTVQVLAREVPSLRPEVVGRLAWSLGMLGCEDRGLLDAIATHALMKSGQYTLKQLAEVLWCFGVCNYSPEDGAVVRHLYLQAAERDIPSMGEPHLQLLCQVHILLASGWQGFPFGEDLQRLNASGWANKLSSVWDGVLRSGAGPAAMHRSVVGDEVAQALQLGVSGAAARPRATESLHHGLFKLPILLPARSLASVHIMALLVHDHTSYSHSYPGNQQTGMKSSTVHSKSEPIHDAHTRIHVDAGVPDFHGAEGFHDGGGYRPRLMGPAIWYSRVLELLGWAVVDIHAHKWPPGTLSVPGNYTKRGDIGQQQHRPNLLQLARRAFLEAQLSHRP